MNASLALPSRWIHRHVHGLLLTAAIAAPALLLGHLLPWVGGPVFGIVLGMAARHLLAPAARFDAGIRFGGKQVLQASIIALGFGLSLADVLKTGLESLSVTLVTVSVAFASAWALGRWLRVGGTLTVLIGVGTAICGGSAIAAVTPIIRPDDHETALALSTIFLFNVVAVLVFPLLGHLLQLSDIGFGLWAGTAINDTSSVVAAGYAYSDVAGGYATIVKLTRATLIIPICLALTVAMAVLAKRRRAAHAGGDGVDLQAIFPWFILWFLVASGLRSAGGVPAAALPVLHLLAEVLIVFALSAIGLSANLRRMAAAGLRPIALGLGVWVAVATSSLVVQYLGGQL